MAEIHDGQPIYVAMRKEKGESARTGSMLHECCDCGLRHVVTFSLKGAALTLKFYNCGKVGAAE